MMHVPLVVAMAFTIVLGHVGMALVVPVTVLIWRRHRAQWVCRTRGVSGVRLVRVITRVAMA